ncbi:hypothetical protein Peur_022764 [Populus x canadensis]
MRERCKLARCSVICYVAIMCIPFFHGTAICKPINVNHHRFIFLNLVIFLDNIPFLFFFVVNLSAC